MAESRLSRGLRSNLFPARYFRDTPLPIRRPRVRAASIRSGNARGRRAVGVEWGEVEWGEGGRDVAVCCNARDGEIINKMLKIR